MASELLATLIDGLRQSRASEPCLFSTLMVLYSSPQATGRLCGQALHQSAPQQAGQRGDQAQRQHIGRGGGKTKQAAGCGQPQGTGQQQ